MKVNIEDSQRERSPAARMAPEELQVRIWMAWARRQAGELNCPGTLCGAFQEAHDFTLSGAPLMTTHRVVATRMLTRHDLWKWSSRQPMYRLQLVIASSVWGLFVVSISSLTQNVASEMGIHSLTGFLKTFSRC
jgi:hypothetical protein